LSNFHQNKKQKTTKNTANKDAYRISKSIKEYTTHIKAMKNNTTLFKRVRTKDCSVSIARIVLDINPENLFLQNSSTLFVFIIIEKTFSLKSDAKFDETEKDKYEVNSIQIRDTAIAI
jgi:hypothetical protein